MTRLASGSLERREAVQVLGLSHYLAGHLAESIPYLEEVRTLVPDDVKLAYTLGMAYAQTRQPDKAREAFARTFRVAPDSAAGHLIAGQMMNRLELEAFAEAELNAALKADPKLPEAHYLLGQIAIFRSRLDEGLALMRDELAINPAHAMALYRIGDIYSRQLKWDAAITALQQSLWINPYYSGPYILLGKAYSKTGQLDAAEDMLRRADPLRSEQQVGALPARAGPSADRPRRRGQARVRHCGTAAGRRGEVTGRRPATRRIVGAWAVLLAAWWPAASAQPGTPPWPVSLVDVADRAGLREPSVYGGVDRKRFIIETNGAGVALLDYDNDGWLDALVLSGTRLQEGSRATQTFAEGKAPLSRLYRNNHDGTFSDATSRAGLNASGWASGVCAGDYDNDGWLDLFLTYYGQNVLYRNRGDGRFEDVTARAGLPAGGTRWGSGCAFVDYDRDGRADLFVANYLRFDLGAAAEVGQGPNCLWKGIPVNCGPRGLPTDTNLLFHNEGNGAFRDVSAASGVARVTGRYPMTAAAADLDGDGWIDIYVACDSTASILYRNNRDGTFTDTAVESGVAYSENGAQQAGMGVAVGDYNTDGLLDLVKTHFADDIPALVPESRQGPVRRRRRRRRHRRDESLRRVGRGHARPRQRRTPRPRVRHRQCLP